jgi:hypothetical protein
LKRTEEVQGIDEVEVLKETLLILASWIAWNKE